MTDLKVSLIHSIKGLNSSVSSACEAFSSASRASDKKDGRLSQSRFIPSCIWQGERASFRPTFVSKLEPLLGHVLECHRSAKSPP